MHRILFSISWMLMLVVLAAATGCSSGSSGGGGSAAQPNTLPTVSVNVPNGNQTGMVSFSVTVVDSDGDNVDLVLEFTTDGVSFSPLVLAAGSDALAAISASSVGTTLNFLWDSAAAGVGTAQIVNSLQIAATPSDAATGSRVLAQPFSVSNLTNQPPTVTVTSPTGVQMGDTTLLIDVRDIEGDIVSVQVEFSLDGLNFQVATLLPAAFDLNNLIADADGEIYSLVWDTVADNVALTQLEAQVEVRFSVSDTVAGVPVTTSVFAIDNQSSSQPLVGSVAPLSGEPGTAVTITGFNFGSDPTAFIVIIGGVEARVLSLLSTPGTTPAGEESVLVVAVAPEVEHGPVVVEFNGSLLDVTGASFAVSPRIDRVRPVAIGSISIGTQVQIFGKFFENSNTQIRFDDGVQQVTVLPSSISDTLVQVGFPSGLAIGSNVQIQVLTDAGESNRAGLIYSSSSSSPLAMLPSITEVFRPLRSSATRVPLNFRLADTVAGDLANVVVSFSIDGSAFSQCTESDFAPLPAILVASPFAGGMEYFFYWNAAADVGVSFRSHVRIRIQASDSATSQSGPEFITAPFWLEGQGAVSILESFEDNNIEDPTNTTADWNQRLGSAVGQNGSLVGRVDFSAPAWGTGVDGIFNPVSNISLLTDGVDPVFGGQDGVFEFSEINIPAGVTVTAVGSRPLRLLCTGDVRVDGVIDLSGGNGASASAFAPGVGGLGGAGASVGGNGGTVVGGVPVDGGDGERGGAGGQTAIGLAFGVRGGGGGGAGAAQIGGDGFTSSIAGSGQGGEGGIARGLDAVDALCLGAGGGGGGGSIAATGAALGYGGGGGGGGGTLSITSQSMITVSGRISVDGGAGGDGSNGGSGGGGSAGTLRLGCAGPIIFETGVELSAQGGLAGSAGVNAPAGGEGSVGRVLLLSPQAVSLPSTGGAGSSSFNLSQLVPAAGSSSFSQGSIAVADIPSGSGAAGAFAPVSNITLTTDGADPAGGMDGVFEFTTINIPAGVVVTVTGSNPIRLLATGNVSIAGSIDVSGSMAPPVPFIPIGSAGIGGAGGPGGGAGGAGGQYLGTPPIGVAIHGEAGGVPNALVGLGGSGAFTVKTNDGISRAGGGGGGSFAEVGGPGDDGTGPFSTPGGAGAAAFGQPNFRDPLNPQLFLLTGGSGGGGGGANPNGTLGGTTGGAGGGGGGGAVMIACSGVLTLEASAEINASGGQSAQPQLSPAGEGGGGGGGGVLLLAAEMHVQGSRIDVSGGSPPLANVGVQGGTGSPGRIRIEVDSVTSIVGTITPSANVAGFDSSLRRSFAQSAPIRLNNAFGMTTYGAKIDQVNLTPAIQTSPAEVYILWGVWQEALGQPGVPLRFSGFTEQFDLLPPGEFLQFRVLIDSGTQPIQAGSLDLIEVDASQN